MRDSLLTLCLIAPIPVWLVTQGTPYAWWTLVPIVGLALNVLIPSGNLEK